MRRLAGDEGALDAQPAASLVLLANQLFVGPEDVELANWVLRRSAFRHPADFYTHLDLGWFLRDGPGYYREGVARREEIVRHFTAAVAIRPRSPIAHYALGNALRDLAKPDEAIAEFGEAIRIDGDRPGEAIFALGRLFESIGRGDEAVAVYREAIRIDPGSARARSRIEAALRAKDLAGRFPAFLKGEDVPVDAANRLIFAQMCRDRGYHAAAARTWAEAMRVDPKLADDRENSPRYAAACAAAMAAAGKGQDDPPPDDAAKARLRGQALDWLKADLAALSRAFEGDPTPSGPGISPVLHRWKTDVASAGVRDPDALAGLPEAEREGWRAFWAEVNALYRRGREPVR